MASGARKKLRSVYGETISSVGRLTATLFVTCVSVIILGSADDRVLITSGDVKTPFIGQTRYEIFMVLAPVSIIGLRFYIDMQIAYLQRIMDVARRFRVARPIGMSAANNRAMLTLGAVGVHALPPAAIAFLGRHASALYPIYGLCLLALAALLLLWSYWLVIKRRKIGAALANVAGLSAGVGAVSAALMLLMTVERAQGGKTICKKRYDGYGAEATTGLLRKIHLERLDFSGISATARNLSCGSLSKSVWEGADLRESILSGADLRDADLSEADLNQSEINDAVLRGATLIGAKMWLTRLYISDLNGANFDGARLEEARLNGANLDGASFVGSHLRYASLYKSKGDRVSFSGADLIGAKLHFSELSDVAFRKADLRRADFFNAKLWNPDFFGADLSCARFSGATLNNPDFSGVEPKALKQMDFTPASVKGALWPDGFRIEDAGAEFEEDRC